MRELIQYVPDILDRPASLIAMTRITKDVILTNKKHK